MVRKYLNQDYRKLKQDSQRRGELFTDPTFPPSAESLYLSGKSEGQDVVWKRPRDICSDPHLVVNGLSASDLNQGVVGNCWFVAACSALALEPPLWEKVVPDHQAQEWDSKHAERYNGIFHFRFWRFGEWVDVVIDDYLPTQSNQLIYCKSKDENEFWSPLLEKAYAKMAGSYEALSGGQTGDALVDFTGGLSEYFDVRDGGLVDDEEKKMKLFEDLLHAHDHRAMISCSIALKEGEAAEGELPCGLIKGHAYTITNVKKMSLSSGLMSIFKKEKLMMIKMRNPWGKKEWNGPWSDGSEEWTRVPKKEKDKMDLKVEDDGEFWMEFSDWCQWYTSVSICRLVNTRVLSLQKTWHEGSFVSKWQGRSAGGCSNHKETFLHNPQCTFAVTESQEVMASLMQQDPRAERSRGKGKEGESKNFSIGFLIMKVEENRMYRIHSMRQSAGNVTYSNKRAVFGRFTLDQGRYIVVPSTFEPGLERDFLLRLYTERDCKPKMLTRDEPKRGVLGFLCCCCYRRPQATVTVRLLNAQGLAKQDMVGVGADPYCKVTCEGTTVITPICKDTLEPKFNCDVVFYVKKPAESEVKIQVINHNVLVDKFMGQVIAVIPRDGGSDRHTQKLMDKGRNHADETQGSVTFTVECSHNLRAT